MGDYVTLSRLVVCTSITSVTASISSRLQQQGGTMTAMQAADFHSHTRLPETRSYQSTQNGTPGLGFRHALGLVTLNDLSFSITREVTSRQILKIEFHI